MRLHVQTTGKNHIVVNNLISQIAVLLGYSISVSKNTNVAHLGVDLQLVYLWVGVEHMVITLVRVGPVSNLLKRANIKLKISLRE